MLVVDNVVDDDVDVDNVVDDDVDVDIAVPPRGCLGARVGRLLQGDVARGSQTGPPWS